MSGAIILVVVIITGLITRRPPVEHIPPAITGIYLFTLSSIGGACVAYCIVHMETEMLFGHFE